MRPQSIKSKLRAVTVCGIQLWLLCLPAARHIRGCQHCQEPQLAGRGAGSLSGSSAGLRKARQARQLGLWPCHACPGLGFSSEPLGSFTGALQVHWSTCTTCLLGPQTFSHPAPSASGCFWNQMWSKAGFQLGSLSTVYLKSTEPEVMQCKPRQAGHDIPT